MHARSKIPQLLYTCGLDTSLGIALYETPIALVNFGLVRVCAEHELYQIKSDSKLGVNAEDQLMWHAVAAVFK